MIRLSVLLNVLICLFLLPACGTKPGDGAIPPGDFSERHLPAEDYVKELDALRSGLASTIGDSLADAETFTQVCKPVGQRARAISEETGWAVQQLAIKYRNPAHEADELAVAIMERFEEFPELQSVWERVLHPQHSGWRYFVPIRVESSCLACHGAQEDRPQFVVDEYPEDTAYDFAVDDLRGVYSVFVPDSTGS